MSVIDDVITILEQGNAIKPGTPLFDLAAGFFYYGTERRVNGKSTCLLDLMWICNARIMTQTHPLCRSEKTPQSFHLVKMPALFTCPIMEMSTQQIVKTADALMWALDGDIYDETERNDEWFDQMEEALELVRRRAYFLAATTLGPELHNIEDFANSRVVDETLAVGNCDSDDEAADIDIGQLLARENKQSTQLNECFVWDMNSMITHMEILLRSNKMIQLSWIHSRVGEERARILKRVQDPNLIKEMLYSRRAFECDLVCNRADKRIYKRNVPMRTTMTCHMILGAKRPSLIDADHFPQSLEEMTRKLPTNKPAYRLNYDAMLCFDAKQNFENADQFPASVVNMLILDDWERFPSLELGPRIIRLRALQKWGVVFEWFRVYYVDSLLGAYIFLKQELVHRGKPLELIVPSKHVALGSKRRKLE